MSGTTDTIVRTDVLRKPIDGIGACFGEFGWTALGLLPEEAREAILGELGAGLALCRMPIGADDFSMDWYSCEETPGDLALEDFSSEHDRARLIPFIGAAQNQLASSTPGGGGVLVVQNDLGTPLPMRIAVDGSLLAATPPADSFSTFVVHP